MTDHDVPGSGWIVERPALWQRIEVARKVVIVSAPAGTGKSSLIRSWVERTRPKEHVAWVTVRRGQRDAQAFWLEVVDALRNAGLGQVVRESTPAPDLEPVDIVGRLIEDLRPVSEPLWLVIDDLHELDGEVALDRLEHFLTATPETVRFILLTRSDLRVGSHRLRLEGRLVEIRAHDLRFDTDDARLLLRGANVALPEDALRSLVAVTEGWAAGLRLAALSLAGSECPETLARSFSGRDRGVAEYLLIEVLERLPADVRRMLLRTSILERVCPRLADHLTGGIDSERMLCDLEAAGGFVLATDRDRTWFRYHALFADLLERELRSREPGEISALHLAAAEWLSTHDQPLQAIRHAQQAEAWTFAGLLLADNWFRLYLDGQSWAAQQLLGAFPKLALSDDPELAVLAADAARMRGSIDEAQTFIDLATQQRSSVPAQRCARFDLALTLVRLRHARACHDLAGVVEQAHVLLASNEPRPAIIEMGLGEDLRALALTDLGIAEIWAGELVDAEGHLRSALSHARRFNRPILELRALIHLAFLAGLDAPAEAQTLAGRAIELAARHGWERNALLGVGYIALCGACLWRGQLAETDRWIAAAEGDLLPEAQPAAAFVMYSVRALSLLIRGETRSAAAAYQRAGEMERLLVSGHMLAARTRSTRLLIEIERGELTRSQLALEDAGGSVLEPPLRQLVSARLHLALGRPEAAAEALVPIFDGSTPILDPRPLIHALLVEARVRDHLNDIGAVTRALERALDLAEPQGLLLPFAIVPAEALLRRHARLTGSHASLISDILALLSGGTRRRRHGIGPPLGEALSATELRVLRFLPSNLQMSEIAAQLHVSPNTIRTHMRHIYSKLDVHRRAEAVERARDLGLLAPPVGAPEVGVWPS